jgi:hypothetical protein
MIAKRAELCSLVDTRSAAGSEALAEEVRDVRRVCRWLDQAAVLYGKRRIARELNSYDSDGSGWVEYWRRWRTRDRRHLVPAGVLADALGPMVNIGPHVALARRCGVEWQERTGSC